MAEILGAGTSTLEYFKQRSFDKSIHVYSYRSVEPSDFVKKVKGFTIYAVDDSNPQVRGSNVHKN